jgi:uncharacterized membrane protein
MTEPRPWRARARAFVSEAVGQDPLDRRTRRALLGLAVAAGVAFFALSYLRYATFHNRTFDLAFYARMSWGDAHVDGWQPIIGASNWGLHLVWFLHVLGFPGQLVGHVRLLLVLQAAALAASIVPLARVAARHLGATLGVLPAALLAALALLLHPNTGHVAAEDFHPGTVAVLPLAWLVEALDRRSARGVVLFGLLVLSCREDLGLVTALAAALLAWRTDGNDRRLAIGAALFSLAYVALFALVLLPHFGPRTGSLALHFGHVGGGHVGGGHVGGGSPASVVVFLLTHPGELVEHLGTPARLGYLPTVLSPLAFLPLLAPELLLLAAPILGIALFSSFPTTTHLDSHYLTPALPMLVAAVCIGLGRAVRRFAALGTPRILVPALAPVCVAHLVAGGTPIGGGFDRRAYGPDANTAIAEAIVDRVGEDASVQAPDPLLAHFAARLDLRRAPPPETGSLFVVLDVSHRRRLRHDEDLLRTDEEPIARAWLARDDHALVAMGGDYALLERGRDPRQGIGFSSVRAHEGPPDAGRALTGCLRLVGARSSDDGVTLDLLATGPCPPDLALRIGVGHRPRRVDLIAGGTLSPAHLRAGDRITSDHPLTGRERAAVEAMGLRVGALRESGAPPEHGDPPALDVPLGG